MKVGLRRVYDPPGAGEDLRVLVDRVWPRGIARDKVDLWLKEIAPSADLRKWYGHVPERWPVFRQKYRKELAANPEAVAELRKAARGRKITLLYGAKDRERNQAVVLAEYLGKKR
ncbi:MAG TPA: DUF488 family protein [Micropepsaceae bacterium]|nr:DUF488 family protein [Micropepsaceae bacterium]